MKMWHVVAVVTLLVLGFAAWRIVSVEHERNAPGVTTSKPAQRAMTEDEMVVPRRMFIDSVKSARALNGKSVWMKSGYTIPYYAYRTGHVDFPHQTGALPPAQELRVKDFVEIATPPDWTSSIARGAKNVFVVFTLPGRDGEFAAPVATLDGANSNWDCDDMFFYQDPKSLYHWPADIWQAVQQHTAKQGMSELQTTMALGNLQKSESKDYGNRTVSYTTIDQGQQHRFDVAFAQDKATSVRME